MLSRRNFRIKILQVLYASSMAPETSPEAIVQLFERTCQRSYKLLLYTLHLLISVTHFAVKDEQQRKARLLASEDDALFKPILFLNPLTQSIVENKYFAAEIKTQKIPEPKDLDIPKKIYYDFSKTDEYIAYWKDNQDHKEVLLALLKFCMNHPLFQELLDDYNPAWTDDKSLILGSMKKIIKALPSLDLFFEEYKVDKEIVDDFSQNMLLPVWTNSAELNEIIKPTLKNWDLNRIALIDLILLKMAVCEFMNFDTVPTKVTLNEFVEIAKQYSTDKSKEFINGILDSLMKEMLAKGKILKTGRGLNNE